MKVAGLAIRDLSYGCWQRTMVWGLDPTMVLFFYKKGELGVLDVLFGKTSCTRKYFKLNCFRVAKQDKLGYSMYFSESSDYYFSMITDRVVDIKFITKLLYNQVAHYLSLVELATFGFRNRERYWLDFVTRSTNTLSKEYRTSLTCLRWIEHTCQEVQINWLSSIQLVSTSNKTDTRSIQTIQELSCQFSNSIRYPTRKIIREPYYLQYTESS